ncbi:MAG: hypothetical protein WCD18_26360 [Thermosynechococcaceae cyanobacterium]
MQDNTGEQVQRDAQTGVIALTETMLIAGSVAYDLYRSRQKAVQVKVKSPTNSVPADLGKAREMLGQGKSKEEIAELLRQGGMYRTIQQRNGKGEQYLDEIIESAKRKNRSKFNPSAAQQKTQKPRKIL